ncbi:AraC family transcriptional regulator [Parabacteroides chongii]|uniref:AraC family transcriptional regulator n=1 Tax=Parabacteroides chongii TaxID=2685834 RepID=UPI00240E44B9|nr:AraC family transcriptional regulator [Parabacteroides chongii]WFE84878.1 AraC family transcriptional regulator [Parabacteroides chongii]
MKEKENTDLILLNIGYAVHCADWNYKNVNSPFARIYLVRQGIAKLHLQDQVQSLTPGHLYLIPPFTLHSYECDDFYTLYYIHIYENPLSNQRILEDYIFPVEVDATPLDSQLVEQLAVINPERNLKEYDPSNYDNSSTLMQNILLHTKNPTYTMMETQGILLQLLSRFMKEATHKYEITDNRIRKTIRYIRKNIDKNITIDELTEICCLSKDHFIRLFKEEMHITPVQYINQKKIEKAQLLIITDNRPVKDIAYTLSFENVSYFNRLFKRYTGLTPVMYKSKL